MQNVHTKDPNTRAELHPKRTTFYVRWLFLSRIGWHFVPFVAPLMVLLVWQLMVTAGVYPTFILPAPFQVGEKFLEVLNDGRLLHHTRTTLEEVLLGLLWGAGAGVLVGYLIAKFPMLETVLSPLIVLLQSTPIVAYAPLLIVWFGSGTMSKVVTCALIVFFPMLMNTVVGIRQVPKSLRALMVSLNATPFQTLRKLEIPFALPVLLTGLKTSATLAVIGAVVGEFISAKAGLGFMVMQARNQYDTALVFVGVMSMTTMALSLYGMVSLLEWRFLAWQRHTR